MKENTEMVEWIKAAKRMVAERNIVFVLPTQPRPMTPRGELRGIPRTLGDGGEFIFLDSPYLLPETKR